MRTAEPNSIQARCSARLRGSALRRVPELIEEERTGLLFEPGDASGLAHALERLVGDAALRRRLGAAARAHVGAGFAIEEMTERFLLATSR